MHSDELVWDVAGFDSSPAPLLENTFRSIAEKQMTHLPFYLPGIPVKACGFTLFEGQWIGAMLTPWMMELMVLPGPGQEWPRRKLAERMALSLPQGDMAFRVGELTPELHYLACSLMSPLDSHLGAEQAVQLAENSVRLALSLPVRSEPEVNQSRRAFLRGNVAR